MSPLPQSYPLGWLNNETRMHVIIQCKLTFTINKKFIDEVVTDVVPLDICGIIFGNLYLWNQDGIYYRKLN